MAVYSQVSACEQPPEPFKANWTLVYILHAQETSHRRSSVMNCWLWQKHDSLVYCYRTRLVNEKCHLSDVQFGPASLIWSHIMFVSNCDYAIWCTTFYWFVVTAIIMHSYIYNHKMVTFYM